MLPVWRVTRTPYGRAVYETLERVGLTATRMYEYVAPTETETDRTADATLDVYRPDDSKIDGFVETYDAFDELRDDEWVVGATVDGDPVGYLFVSTDATLYTHPLEEDLSFDGAYVRPCRFSSPRRSWCRTTRRTRPTPPTHWSGSARR
ncbi:hypothetical protein SAMN04487948_12218 [Halogranum amylolyticum]|uniref:Uncharacterized protein n=1 Tax=Halogranum amylolyticum TaxID=660520 RepID=A0A1H8W1Q1_9EURY|nr:hypothetical protein [Halogranum amylolyticum]SEP21520.1 hypothetical protein SAMN04487948_12218 [Halogranum amylolyticum]